MLKIGEYEVYSVVTGHFRLDGGAMFGVVPKTLWEQKFAGDLKNRIEMVTRSLLLVSEYRKILVDSGNGGKWPPKQREIYAIENADLAESLSKFGLVESDITDVIITHLHFDHVGGCTRIDADKIAPVFPKARHYIQKSNYEHASFPGERDRASYLKENWAILEEKGMLEILDGSVDLAPGIHLEISNGHTPGQQLPLIFDGKNTLFYAGDLIPTHAHIPISWGMAYDLEPLRTIEEKKRILSLAADQRWIVFYEHDASMAASYVVREKKNFVAGEEVFV